MQANRRSGPAGVPAHVGQRFRAFLVAAAIAVLSLVVAASVIRLRRTDLAG